MTRMSEAQWEQFLSTKLAEPMSWQMVLTLRWEKAAGAEKESVPEVLTLAAVEVGKAEAVAYMVTELWNLQRDEAVEMTQAGAAQLKAELAAGMAQGLVTMSNLQAVAKLGKAAETALAGVPLEVTVVSRVAHFTKLRESGAL